MRRRDLLHAAIALPMAAATLARPTFAQPAPVQPAPAQRVLAHPALTQADAARTLRVIPQANLTSLDPVWTTAVVTRNHAYMIYDQLLAADADGHPQPQMADSWDTSDDGRTWTLALRKGLMFHDGTPVLARDCVASIRRWWQRDGLGQALNAATDTLDAPDDRTIRFRLKHKFPLLAVALAKPSPMPLFIMPERIAATDAFKQITDPTGSGPFRFCKADWNPGATAVWEKFDGYVPRTEFPDGIAGGRRANVDRIVWTVIPDSATAANALINNEQDYWEYPLHDLLPLLKTSANVTVSQRLANGTYAGIRLNHLQPPFNNPKVRAALLLAIDQRDYLRAVVGDAPSSAAPARQTPGKPPAPAAAPVVPKAEGSAQWGVCDSVYTCGTRFASEVGTEALRARSLDQARAALKASGYKGERTVILDPADYPQIHALTLVTADLLRRIGFNVDLVATDWGTVTQRRTSKAPADKGGWSVFHSTWSGADMLNPAINQNLRANGADAWYGWPSDPTIERLRDVWMQTDDVDAQKKLADAIQAQAFRSVPFVPLGYYWQPSAWRKSVTGTFKCPVTAFWNVGKAA